MGGCKKLSKLNKMSMILNLFVVSIMASTQVPWSEQEDIEKVRDLRNRIQKSPQDISSRFDLAILLEKMGRVQDATEVLLDFVDSLPREKQDLQKAILARLLIRERDRRDAI